MTHHLPHGALLNVWVLVYHLTVQPSRTFPLWCWTSLNKKSTLHIPAQWQSSHPLWSVLMSLRCKASCTCTIWSTCKQYCTSPANKTDTNTHPVTRGNSPTCVSAPQTKRNHSLDHTNSSISDLHLYAKVILCSCKLWLLKPKGFSSKDKVNVDPFTHCCMKNTCSITQNWF